MYSKVIDKLLHLKLMEVADFASEKHSLEVLNTSMGIAIELSLGIKFKEHLTIRPAINSKPLDVSCWASGCAGSFLALKSSINLNAIGSWTKIPRIAWISSDKRVEEMNSDAEFKSEDSVIIIKEENCFKLVWKIKR